jgi:hypothetical protein
MEQRVQIRDRVLGSTRLGNGVAAAVIHRVVEVGPRPVIGTDVGERGDARQHGRLGNVRHLGTPDAAGVAITREENDGGAAAAVAL